MGCDISKIRDELNAELYSSGMSPKSILAHKKNISKYIYELKMTAEPIKSDSKENKTESNEFSEIKQENNKEEIVELKSSLADISGAISRSFTLSDNNASKEQKKEDFEILKSNKEDTIRLLNDYISQAKEELLDAKSSEKKDINKDIEGYQKVIDSLSRENKISGSGPNEWRNDENVTEKFNFGYQEIGEFIDTLVKATGDMTARTDNTGYHQNLKTLVDLIKDSMSENNFKKAIEIVGINTNDEFSNATYEENTDKDAKALNHSGEEMNLGGRLTIRYGKDYKEEMKDESGNPLDSYKNTFSGFRELVLHEVLHAMIDEAMNLDKALYAKVSAIQKQYAKKVTLESMSKSMKARSGEEPTANNLMQMKDIIEYINASPVEFLTYTMTNPIVYDIMESDKEAAKIDLVDSGARVKESEKKSAFQKIMDTIINIINKVYTIKTFGSKIENGSVKPKTGLDMIQELTTELMLKNIALEKINSAYRSKIADDAIFGNYDFGGPLNISSKYKKFDDQLKELGGKAFKKVLEKKDSSGLSGKLEQTASWFNEFSFIKNQKENGNLRIFSDIMNTIVEDTTSEDGGSASFYQLIRNIKKNRDNGKVEMTQVARNKVDDLWKDMSKEQRESATFMLQADWKGLGLTLDEYSNIVNDDSAIDAEIKKLKKEINIVEYNEGAKHLGFYMVHGVSKSPELMRNADMIFNRAYDSKRRTLVDPKFEKQYVEKIDKLASYYALKYMDKNIRKEIESSIKKDKELVEATSNMYYSYYDQQAYKFRETGLHKYLEKGGMRKSSEVDMKFEVLPEDQIRTGRFTAHDKVRLDKATTDAMNDGKDYWLVVSRDFSPSRTQGGFDDIHIIDKGLGLRSVIGGKELIKYDVSFDGFINKRIEKAPHFLNKEHDDSLESMIAMENQLVASFDIYGNVIDYEIPISELDRKEKGRLNNDIASTLSQTISHIHSKENAVKNNGLFAKMLVQESDKNAGKPGYVLLRPSTQDEIKAGNKHKYDEEWAMIPNYIQKMILAKDSKGNNTRDGLWVKEGRINNIIGYKDMTIANLKLAGKDMNDYPDMQRALQVIEYFWKQMASRYKEIVVKLFPAVVWANITSNMWVAMRHGIGPMEYAKGFIRNWSNLTTYLELSEESIKAQLDLDSGAVNTDAKILELQKQMKNNSFHKLIEDGQFNSIMEDLDSTGLTKKSHIEDYFDIGAKKGGKLGEQTKSVVENLYIGRNTSIHKNIEKLTVFNDIINRSIIMERMMQDLDSIDGLEPDIKNAKTQDILNYVDQLFVNYSYLDNKVVKYLNDINLVLFTKYFFRALKANISMMTRYPLASLGFEGYDEFVVDVSDSLDQYGNPIDSFMNRVIVTPVEVASELIIPNSVGIFIR